MPSMLSIMFDVMTDANLDSQQRVVEMLKESTVSDPTKETGEGYITVSYSTVVYSAALQLY